MTAVEVLAACSAEGVVLSLTPEGGLRYEPAPSRSVLNALRRCRADLKRSLREASAPPSPPPPIAYDPARDAVRIEYDDDGATHGFWLVPDTFTAATHEGEPAIRRSDAEGILANGEGALRRGLLFLRAFPGSRAKPAKRPSGGRR